LAQENEEKKKKYSNYKKTKINKEEENKNEKKLGRIYTTLKNPEKKNYNNKNNNYKTPFDKQRTKSSMMNNNKIKKEIYEDDITQKFMKNEANDYNGMIKDNKGNLIMNPSGEIEYLLLNHKVYNSKVNQIKNFLNNMK
jgi:hypothetical protein